MEFIESGSDVPNHAEQATLQALRAALIDDEGIGYHRYPIFSADRSRREPDLMLLHREWGLYVIECKGCRIHNIVRIDGQRWEMADWHSPYETPYSQGEDQLFSILGRFQSERSLRRGRTGTILQGHVFIALPFISRAEWELKGLHLSPAAPTTIIFEDDLAPERLRQRLQQVPAEERQEPLTDDQWQTALGILRGDPVLRRETRPEVARPASKAAMLREVEQQIQGIDQQQQKVAIQIPPGPQRLRGLAGSGKTVVMCMRAAHMHLRYPDWDIAYTFYTQSLRDQIQGYITRFYRWWSDKDPNWNKIHILHGWGSRAASGMYSHTKYG